VRLAATGTGDVWAAGLLANGLVSDCVQGGLGSGLDCPALVKVDATRGVVAGTILGGVLRRRQSRAIALSVDAQGAAYVVLPAIEPAYGSNGRILVRRFATNGVPDWSSHLPETWGVDPGEIAIDGSGRVYIGTNNGSIGGSVTMPTIQQGAFVYRLTAAGVADDARVVNDAFQPNSVASGLSIDGNGTLSYVGHFLGTLDGASSDLCLPSGDTRRCSDIFVKRFNF
jgi:hypothetical protein